MSSSFDAVVIELNPSERRAYDTIREQIVKRPPGGGSGLREVLLLLPDLTVLLMRLLRDDRVPRVPKLIAMIGVGYVLSPIDLMPALLLGPLGLVDDLLVVTAALSRLLNDVHPDIVRAAWPGQGDALDAIQRVSRWSQDQIGGRLRRAFGLSTRVR
jgi:uncharacterized membrane protein YkvA (DUF1232 family)